MKAGDAVGNLGSLRIAALKDSIADPFGARSLFHKEIGVLRGQCLKRRIGDRQQLVSQIAACEKQRNKARARIKWMFTVQRARTKLARAYPGPSKES